ncbi:MAG: alpha/beta fold hydrolase [Candidatus Fermentibacteraceae bacterium]
MKPGKILLIHGFTSGPFAFEFLIPALKQEGFAPVVPTLRGHGHDSWKKLSGFTWKDWLEDARKALDEATGEDGRAVIVGHSMGGLLALNLAADNPGKVRSIVLAGAAIHLASPFTPGHFLGFLQHVLGRVFKSWDMTPFYTDKKMLASDRNYRRAPMSSINTMIELVSITKKRLFMVTSPTLILQGRRDRRVSFKSAEMIRKGISTPENLKSVVMFSETDHEMFRDCERGQVITGVLEHLAALEDSSP